MEILEYLCRVYTQTSSFQCDILGGFAWLLAGRTALTLLVLQAVGAAASPGPHMWQHNWSVGLGRCSAAWGSHTAVGSEFSFLSHPTEVLYHIVNVFEHLAELY